MNDNEINIAIAEAVKWKPSVDSGICWDGNGKPIVSPPSYTTDLNAMHEAEQILDKLQNGWQEYADWLETICGTDGWTIMSQFDKRKVIHATARQRAEAFLRTLGKWKD